MNKPSTNRTTTTTSNAGRKPSVSIAIATALGLGYLPKAPGTWGSLGGILLAMLPFWLLLFRGRVGTGVLIFSRGEFTLDSFVFIQCLLSVGIAVIGVWAADRAAKYWKIEDPQKVVIDEVSGQMLALLLGGFWPLRASAVRNPWNDLVGNHRIFWAGHPLGTSMWVSPNWKYLLLGFILFRVFDIWKPFPARQAESLPGGWGIMADDWAAGIYAGLGLWAARALGL